MYYCAFVMKQVSVTKSPFLILFMSPLRSHTLSAGSTDSPSWFRSVQTNKLFISIEEVWSFVFHLQTDKVRFRVFGRGVSCCSSIEKPRWAVQEVITEENHMLTASSSFLRSQTQHQVKKEIITNRSERELHGFCVNARVKAVRKIP